MSHGEHPNPNLQDDPKPQPLILGGLIGVLLVVVTVVSLTALYYRNEKKFVADRIAEPAAALSSPDVLKSTQMASLHAPPRWIDRKTGVVSIPIEQAMELVLRDNGKNPKVVIPEATPQPGAAAMPTAGGSAASGPATPGSGPAGSAPASRPAP